MGISSLSDFVTGLALEHREPVVAVVVGRRTGGFPDAEKAAARPGIGFNHIFEPLSLPIRGRAGDYGDFHPDPGQVAVDLACEMTGAASWEAFAAEAFDFGKGTRIREDERFASAHRSIGIEIPEKEPRVLGAAVVAEATWNALTALWSDPSAREADVALVRDALADAEAQMERARGQRTPESDRLAYRAVSLQGLGLSGSWTFADGSTADLPPLARALGDMEPTSGEEFRAWLKDNLGRGERLDAVLRGLWDLDAMRSGLNSLNRPLLPSPNGGQYVNAEEVFAASLSAMEQAAGTLIAKVLVWGEGEEAERLEALLARTEELRASLAARLAAARLGEGDEPDGTDGP